VPEGLVSRTLPIDRIPYWRVVAGNMGFSDFCIVLVYPCQNETGDPSGTTGKVDRVGGIHGRVSLDLDHCLGPFAFP